VSIRVRVIGDLRRFVESDTVEIAGGGCKLSAVLDELVRRYPRLGRELFDDQGRMHYASVLTMCGRRVTWPQDRDESIEDGGELMLTRFHSGG
jgi:molybdopterin converting factor small subunit